MPLSSPNLQRLRLRSGVKPGRFAEMVEAARSHYSNVEHRRVVGSRELFERCASTLGSLLGVPVDPDDLIAGERKLDRDQERKSGHVSPQPLEPARPVDEPTRPPNKPDSSRASAA